MLQVVVKAEGKVHVNRRADINKGSWTCLGIQECLLLTWTSKRRWLKGRGRALQRACGCWDHSTFEKLKESQKVSHLVRRVIWEWKRQDLSHGLVVTLKILVFSRSNEKLFKGFMWEVICSLTCFSKNHFGWKVENEWKGSHCMWWDQIKLVAIGKK